MADTFVKMVEFRSTGLDKIETGLRRTVVVSDSAIRAGTAYQKVIDNTLRSMPSMVRVFEAGVRVQKEQARTLTEVARAQERVNTSSRGGGALRYAGSAIGGAARAVGSFASGAGVAAGAVAAGGFAMGLSGMSGTVPMARFNNQMDRVSWELGNTLTPTINKATTGLAKFANWLSGLSTGQQDVLGGGLAIGAGALGAQVLSRQVFGKGLGGAAASGYSGLARAGGYNAAAGPTPAELAYRAQYGSQGLEPGSMGGTSSKGGAAAGGLGKGLMLVQAIDTISALVQGASGTLPRQRYERGELTPNETNPLAAEYERKFQGLQGDEFNTAVKGELENQKKNPFKNRRWWQPPSPEETGQARGEAMKRSVYLENALKTGRLEGGTADHRGNQTVGGDWGETGSGYYAAASDLAKTGYDKAEGGGNRDIWQMMLDTLIAIKEKNDEKPLK